MLEKLKAVNPNILKVAGTILGGLIVATVAILLSPDDVIEGHFVEEANVHQNVDTNSD